MPFSSYRRWTFQQQQQQQHPSPLLPSSAKSKLSTRKSTLSPGKRAPLLAFVLSNLLTLAILFSILFFLLTLFLFLSPSPHPSQSLTPPGPHRARPVKQRGLNYSLSASSFDVTTKELYDRIEFRDDDGGPWKQGWRVTYRGDEWDGEKLKVFVVPHSHNDPGWKLTVEEYYDKQSRHILDTIVESLSKVAWVRKILDS